MLKLDSVAGVRGQLASWRQDGLSIALVPTMGNLHNGHMSLVDQARALANRVCVTIFVNPTQFGPNEDYAEYPRTLEQDCELLTSHGCDLLMAPAVDEIYPTGQVDNTRVSVPAASRGLCAASRPGHFDGVATVVAGLLNIFQPDTAIFGQKDFQQLMLIRRMVTDLHVPVDVVAGPTVREPSGLAVSSRNRYLTATQRESAAKIYASLCRLRDSIKAGRNIESEIAIALKQMRVAGLEPEYLELRRAFDLGDADEGDKELVVLAAARIGKTRLIDNIQFRR